MSMGRLADVTDQEYESFSEFNRKMVEKFLKQKGATLSPQSLKQYRSGLKCFLKWIHVEQDDKDFVKLKARHASEYVTYLDNVGLSPAGLRAKVAAVSSLCAFVVRNFDDEFPSFRNIFQGVEKPTKADVREKQPMSPEEYQLVLQTLRERGQWQILCYVLFTYSSGCRRAETRQLLKDVVTYEKTKDQKTGESKSYYTTHKIRTKGRGRQGKIRSLIFDDIAMNAIKKWLEVRGEDDCPYVFVARSKDGRVRQVSETTFNYWCSDVLTKIINRRCHPHQLREQRATDLVVYESKDIKAAQALLGHSSATTTEIYVIRSTDSDVDEAFT